jgi:hypothetical protein
MVVARLVEMLVEFGGLDQGARAVCWLEKKSD